MAGGRFGQAAAAPPPATFPSVPAARRKGTAMNGAVGIIDSTAKQAAPVLLTW